MNALSFSEFIRTAQVVPNKGFFHVKKICLTYVYEIKFKQAITLKQTQNLLPSTSICDSFAEKYSKPKLDKKNVIKP